MPNPTIRMTTGEEKYIAGFNPDGTTRFAYTEHDRNPTVGTLQINGVNITPQNGTIDELGNKYLTIGGTTYYKRPQDVTYSIFSEKPMSGADPLGQFFVEGAALSPAFRLAGRGLQYPLAQMGNRTARTKIMERTFNQNFLPEGKTLSYGADGAAHNLFVNNQKVSSNVDNASLKFFERKPSRISEAESIGTTKWERNFKPKWHVANYPGYQLKGLMKGSQLERQLSKNGTININQLNAYFNKASQIEKEVANKILAEKFVGQKTIDYNQFKKAVQDELINYSTKPQTRYSTYGMDRLGFNVIKEPDGAGGILEYLPGVRTNTFTFESPRISVGNNKHYDTTTLGHSRTYTTPDEPNVLHVMESQSDWAQKSLGLTKAEKTAIQNIDEQLKTETPTGFSTLEELQTQKQAILDKASQRTQGISYQAQYLHDNYLQRQLQENFRYAAENGQTKMRYPTSETAAKIEGYQSRTGWFTPEGQEINPFNPTTGNFEAPVGTVFKQVYSPEHYTILKKYAGFPKLFQKLYKGQNVRTVTDTKGKTWYEVDVPKGYLSREWQFKQGGHLRINNTTVLPNREYIL